MDIAASTPVVTGAGRGLGVHLVDTLLDRGVPKVYALARDPSRVRRDERIVPVSFDLLDLESIAAAAQRAADATLLINNASTAAFAGPLDAKTDALEQKMAVNYRGTYATIRAFVPVLEANGGGQIVNVLSLLALSSTPPMTGYSASKAAAHSLTQALRPVLAAKGISVHGVYRAGSTPTCLPASTRPRPRRRRSRPASSTRLPPTPRTSSLTPTHGRWRRCGGTTRSRSSAPSPERRQHDLDGWGRRGRADARPRRRRRWHRLDDLLSRDFEIVEPASLPYGGTHRGVSGYVALMQRIDALFELSFESQRIVALKEAEVLLQMIVTFTARTTGRSVRLRVLELLTVDDGRLARSEVFLRHREAPGHARRRLKRTAPGPGVRQGVARSRLGRFRRNRPVRLLLGLAKL